MAYFFRVDRMVEASPGDRRFDPPVVDDLPDWFDLSAHERTVRICARPEALDAVPRPCRIGEPHECGDGRVEADVTVAGERRLDHLLVSLPADAEVVAPKEYKERRRNYARSLLDLYPEGVHTR
jgi:predicted DNA-binding transcriptional regulator YafY